MKIRRDTRRLGLKPYLTSAALISIGLLLSGCASTAKFTYLPSGDPGFAINCSGSDASSSWAKCYQQASDACGSYGYDIVSKDADDGATAGGSLGGILGANIKSRSMVVKCRH